MKKLLLLFSLLYALLFPATVQGQIGIATPQVDSFQEGTSEICTSASLIPQKINDIPFLDDTAMVSMNGYGNTPVYQHRHSSRLQSRKLGHPILMSDTSRTLSFRIATLPHHISSIYSTLKIPCWKYAVEGYIYAFRHIII